MTTSEELQDRLAAAERESSRKSELLAHTSHEIRTQLSGVIGMTQLVLETRLTPEQAEYIEVINASGESLLTLVNDLLDVSKMEAGHLSIEQIPYSVRDTLSDIVTSFSPQLVERGLWITVEFDPDLPNRVLGDPGRLRQVVANLLNNAAKFTEQGGISVKVDFSDGSLVTVAVSDTGVGIAPDRQAAIFESYTQADETTARTHGGTGLGLVISKRLTEMMGGGLELVSEVGVGSTFTATLRVVPDQSEPSDRYSAATSELAGLPVLLVGEMSDHQREALERLGLVVEAAVDSDPVKDMTAAYRRGAPFALVIVAAPVESLSIAEDLRAQPESRTTHILVLTTTGTRGDAAMCRELQVAGYLTNPYTPEDLARASREVLGGPAPLDLTLLVTKHWLRERRRRLNVLVVDASPTIRMSTNRMLERRGHVVVTAGSAQDALTAVSARRFDAAVVDLELPNASGLELVMQMRGSGETPLPIVASTVNMDRESHESALAAGCSFVLARPFEIHDLVLAIEESVGPV